MAETSIEQKCFQVILLLWWYTEIESILFYGSEVSILGVRIRNKRLKQIHSECQMNTHCVPATFVLSLNFHGNPLK